MSTILFRAGVCPRGGSEPAPPIVERTPYGAILRGEPIAFGVLGQLYLDLAAEGLEYLDLDLAHVLRCGDPLDAVRIFSVVTTREHASAWMEEALARLPASLDDLGRWLCGPDTGMSSLHLAFCLTGRVALNDRPNLRAVPCDAESFGRCVRFLDRFPDLRPNLPFVRHPDSPWLPFLKRWEPLEALYRAEQFAELDEAITALEREAKGAERVLEMHDPRGAVTSIPVALFARQFEGADPTDLDAFLAELDDEVLEDGSTLKLI